MNVSALIRTAIERSFPPEADGIAQDPIEFLLKPGDPTKPPSWDNGGRWFLDWLIKREPDWQTHHLVVLPRHWPLRLSDREPRCFDNGGDSRAVLDHLRALTEARIFPGPIADLSPSDWGAICTRYRGCCGERLRPEGGPHWDAIC